MEHLRAIQKHAQDVTTLACSRFISQLTLRRQGIPPELLSRLEAAFGQAALQDDSLWSRLGYAGGSVLEGTSGGFLVRVSKSVFDLRGRQRRARGIFFTLFAGLQCSADFGLWDPRSGSQNRR